MLLYLMRHGHAATGGASDSERPLSQQGRQEAAEIARHLLQKGTQIDCFYQSTKKRSQETAHIVKEIVNPEAVLETKDGIAPDDPVDKLYRDIPHWKTATMVVSHLPFLPRLISRLVTGKEDDKLIVMPTGSVIVLQHLEKRWSIKEIISPENV